MYYLKNICFICLSDKKPLKAVFREETENEIIAQIKYAIPELFALDSEILVNMCSSCYKELSLHTMTDLLEFYNRFKRYIETLQGASYTRDKKCSELQIRVINCGELIKQESDIGVIKEECEDSVLFCSESEICDFKIKSETIEESVLQFDNQLIIKKEFEDETSKDVKQEQENEDQEVKTEDIDMQEELITKPADEKRVERLTKAELKIRNKWYKCLICMQVLENDISFKNHGRTHFKPGERPKCHLCDRTFSSFRFLTSHLKFHPQFFEFKCKTCTDKFLTERELVKHMISHMVEDKEADSEKSDDEQTGIEEILINLIISNSHVPEGKREYKCLTCCEVFPCNLTMKEHKKTHIKVLNENKCVICDQEFASRTIFFLHGNHHQTVEDGTKCPICKFDFPVYRDLAAHYRKHLNIRNYQCLICNLFFLKQTELNVHMSIHLPENNYACYFCKDNFARRFDLKKHLKTHLRDKQLPCHHCNKTFSTRKKLYLHFKLYDCLKKLNKTQTSEATSSEDTIHESEMKAKLTN